ncbi:unnamed protein product [Closterium sp. Yama58-4]|nr:unnamed protein product [Closterium sp. Yama58-4]
MPDWADVAAVEITETTDCHAGAGAEEGDSHGDEGGGGGGERAAGGDSIAGGASGTLSCPICLESPPLCPQITACGHVFCHPCILRHFATPDARHPDAPPLRPATAASAAAAAAVARAVAAGGSPQRAFRALSGAAALASNAAAAVGGGAGLGGRGAGRGGAGPAGRGAGRGGSGRGAAAAAAAPVVLPTAGLASSVVQRFKRCPLCFASIGSHELRTVTIRSVPAPRVGHMLRFVALMRSKSCVVPFEMHRHHREHFSLAALPFSSTGRCHAFSKLTLTSDSAAAAVTDAAVRALLQRVEEVNESGGEELEQLPYVMDAVNQLLDRQQVRGRGCSMGRGRLGGVACRSGKDTEVARLLTHNSPFLSLVLSHATSLFLPPSLSPSPPRAQAWVEHRQMAFVAASPSHQKGLLSLLKLPIDLPPPPLSPSASPAASLSATSPASHCITSPRARSSPSFPSPPTSSATGVGKRMAGLQLEQEGGVGGEKGGASKGREGAAELEVAGGEEGDGVGDAEAEEEKACIEEAEEEGSVGGEGEDVAAEVERKMHELEASAGWVYESAFSDDEGEDERGEKGGAGKRVAAVSSAEASAAVAAADAAGDSAGAAEKSQGGVSGGEQRESRMGEGTEGGSDAGGGSAMAEKGGRAERHEGDAGRGEGKSGAGRGGKGKGGERVGEGEEVCGWHVFYQAQDGPCVVLHPLNFKCLLQHYGSVERLPLRYGSAPPLLRSLVFSSSPSICSVHPFVFELVLLPRATPHPSRTLSLLAQALRLTGLSHSSHGCLSKLISKLKLPLVTFSAAPREPSLSPCAAPHSVTARVEERDRVKAQHREAVAVAAAAEDGRFFERQRVPAPMDFVPLAQAVAAAGSASATAAAEDSDTGGGDVAAGSAEGEGASGSASHARPMAFSKVTELGYAAGLGSVALSGPSPSATTAPAPPSGPSPVSTTATPAQSVWASRPDFSRAGSAGAGSGAWGSGGAASARGVGSGGEGAQVPGDDGSASSGGGKGKGKKGKKKGTTILLSSGGLPRY